MVDVADNTKRAAAARAVERAPYVEALARENISREKFDEAWFVTQLVEFSHTRSGDVLVKFRVPYMYRHQAAKLADAYGMMLQCHLNPWSQAEEARRENESAD